MRSVMFAQCASDGPSESMVHHQHNHLLWLSMCLRFCSTVWYRMILLTQTEAAKCASMVEVVAPAITSFLVDHIIQFLAGFSVTRQQVHPTTCFALIAYCSCLHLLQAGKAAALFTSTASQGGGQEVTLLTAVTQLAHHGMIYVPPGYGAGPIMFGLDVPRVSNDMGRIRACRYPNVC